MATNANVEVNVILIPPNAPAGGILMTQPPQTAVSFYKVAPSQTVTFGWNFTSVLQDSQSLTVSAICDNGNTYPVGPTDGVLPGTATQVFWDLYSWQSSNPQQPLPQGTCTLTMWDNRGQSALPRPGFMKPFNNLQFGLYTPQPYTPLASGWSCTECHNDSVISAATHPAFIGILVSFLVIFLSGFHLLRPNVA
ncbi:hypothetical protein P691DRAFT_797519 [Macrolepiota fuliginosa MF-IS2]|uniref:DUF7137 domain-containing protein n=1 Tax=Macrolepiota fuliginosa MF-IS2 TaxID=1400762 RepID=A0A9P5X456_9AGAR|nr:hypothetical protein P691DRAFT_797519 [Macrolepiota fuliginosa MF-IS2]